MSKSEKVKGEAHVESKYKKEVIKKVPTKKVAKAAVDLLPHSQEGAKIKKYEDADPNPKEQPNPQPQTDPNLAPVNLTLGQCNNFINVISIMLVNDVRKDGLVTHFMEMISQGNPNIKAIPKK